MKSSPYRKRYVLIYSENMESGLRKAESDLNRIFRAKKKFVKGSYAIFLTNQFYRDQLIVYVNEKLPGFQTLLTSGSIKKCKKAVAEREEVQAVQTKL